ncbi:SPOR domain-containing protein [Ramlibacter sp.]|uniref:SPOR domain-containing protein n=1 Tax=Ramlibacter sp. TaxID=1917967 RepID=UPI003D0E9D4B
MERRTWLGAAASIALGAGASMGSGVAVAAPSRRDRSMAVEAVQAPAWRNEGDERVPLEPGDTVTTREDVETGEGAAMVLALPEGSVIRLGEKTHLQVQRFEATAPAIGETQVRTELKLVDGVFRYTTSAISKVIGQRQANLQVRTATIGIRGTDFWSMTDAVHDAACMFEGSIDLQTRDQGNFALDKPTAFWARFFDQPVRPVGTATPDELAKFLGSTELKPGRGVAVAGGRWRVVAGTFRAFSEADALAKRLARLGYAAKPAARKAGVEVRINHFATRADAQAVLDRLAQSSGVTGGRVALSAA